MFGMQMREVYLQHWVKGEEQLDVIQEVTEGA